MMRSLSLLACLVLTGCVSTGLRSPDVASRLDIPDSQISPAGLDESGGSEEEIKTLLEQKEIGLQELLRIAEINNPQVRSARNDVGAAAGRIWQAELYPNPTVEFEAEDIPSSHLGLTNSENKIALVQPFVIGRRRSHAISAAKAEHDAHHFLVQHKLRYIQGEVRRHYLELIYLKQAIALHSELHDIAQQTLRIAKARFNAKAAPESEMIKTQIDVRELELGGQRLQRLLVSSSARLESLLGGSQVPIERIHGQLPTNLRELEIDILRTAVRERHPAILAAQKEIEAADRRLDQAKSERIPDTEFRLAYGRNAATDENIVEAGISFPLPLFDRRQGDILESRHLAAKARRDAESIVTALLAELVTVHVSYMMARDEATTLQNQIVPDAEKAFAQTKTGYHAGKISLLDLLDAQRTLIRTRLSALKSLKDMNEARALLWKITGVEIEK